MAFEYTRYTVLQESSLWHWSVSGGCKG